MKTIAYKTIVDEVALLCRKATTQLPTEILEALRNSIDNEQSELAKSQLRACVKNAEIASQKHIPICQDTGVSVYMVEIGDEVKIDGGMLTDAINEGTAQGYTRYYLRKSMVNDPVFDRKNTQDNTPAVIHLFPLKGDSLVITMAPKGGGSENMSGVKMLKPSDGPSGIEQYVVEKVVASGGNPCPPVIVGVGIGGTFEMTALLAKKALFRPLGSHHPDSRYADLEKSMLHKINDSGVGPQGLGGNTMALAVHIETMPCHIATMPVAVNLNCHAARHATIRL